MTTLAEASQPPLGLGIVKIGDSAEVLRCYPMSMEVVDLQNCYDVSSKVVMDCGGRPVRTSQKG